MDFKFIQNSISNKWIISSPRRAKRPSMENVKESDCPFCLGNEDSGKEAYRIPVKNTLQDNDEWKVRVILNKFPFAPIHEIVIHSPNHANNFDELTLTQNQLILQVFRQRFAAHQDKGRVCIFHNHGQQAGESLPHPHSQIVVLPDFVSLEIPQIDFTEGEDSQETEHFTIFAPLSSQWPDEVWVAPKTNGEYFSSISDDEIKDLGKVLYRLIQIFDLRHKNEFPFNFYISPEKHWYLRIIPRIKTLGGVEIATGVWVNTQDPKETIAFIKEHFQSPNEEKIRQEHQAGYHKAV